MIYHDIIEVKLGDRPLETKKGKIKTKDKRKKDKTAAESLVKELPAPLNEKFQKLFCEFQAQKTLESRFANAIDKLDPVLQGLDHKNDWRGFTKEFLFLKKLKFFEEFPEIKSFFLECVDFMEEKDYFEERKTPRHNK